MLSTVYLLIMSIIAGVLTGIVGMASLTLYPVLLSVGIPAISANATATIATVGAGVGTTIASLKELKHYWKKAIFVALLSTIGGILGAFILTKISNKGFEKVVPIFILLAGILIFIPGAQAKKKQNRLLTIVEWVSVFLIGIYNGFFGAASGLLMIAVLSKVIGGEYKIYNAIRNFASFISNIFASIIFIVKIPIAWKVIIPLLIGIFISGYLGPIIVRFIPSKIIRFCVGILAIVLSVVLGYQAYF